MGVLRIIRVILFDVILHLCDTTTDILQIYFLFLGKYNDIKVFKN